MSGIEAVRAAEPCRIALGDLGDARLDGRTKGFPGGMPPLRPDELGSQGWSLLNEDLTLPVCVLRDAAVERNSTWMRRFLAATGAAIAPHGKTSMAPELFAKQLRDGAWGITLATIQQVQVGRHCGLSRILLANQLVGRQAMRYVLDEIARDPGFDFYCLADSVALVDTLAAAARARNAGRPLQLLLEAGYAGGRTGVRDLDTGLAVARAVKAAKPHLSLRGVEGFEGLMQGASAVAGVDRFLDRIVELAERCDAEDLFGPGPVMLTAGGSAYFDRVVERLRAAKLARDSFVVTRSGCYLTHDSGLYARAMIEVAARTPFVREFGEPESALEVWAYVQSRPEPTRSLVTMGKRDVSFDADLPAPLKWYRPSEPAAGLRPMPPGHRITGLNDQHGYLDGPAESPLRLGDMIGFGISHPCLTFDRWPVIYRVDDTYRITGAIRTFF